MAWQHLKRCRTKDRGVDINLRYQLGQINNRMGKRIQPTESFDYDLRIIN